MIIGRSIRSITGNNGFNCDFPIGNSNWHSSGILTQIKRFTRAMAGFNIPFDVWILPDRIRDGDVLRRSDITGCTILLTWNKHIPEVSNSKERGIFAMVFWFS